MDTTESKQAERSVAAGRGYLAEAQRLARTGVGLGEGGRRRLASLRGNGIAYMASTQKRHVGLGRKARAFIRRIEKSGSGQSIEQSVKKRITK